MALSPEEEAERGDFNAVLKQYQAEPGRYAVPEKGTDNRWYLKSYAPPPPSPSGFAPPFRPGEEPAAEPEKPGMTMADYQALKSQSHAPPSPGSSIEAAKLHTEDKHRIDAKVKKIADRRRQLADKEAAAKRKEAAQRSLFGE